MKEKLIPLFLKISALEFFAQIGRFGNTGFENNNDVFMNAGISGWVLSTRIFEQFKYYRRL